ncbi:hypothetical protein HK100_011012, partial [Physocladia obscura]
MIEVPEEFLKLENPIRPNANQALKAKIQELEARIKRLNSNDSMSELTDNSLEEVNQALRSKIVDLEETIRQLRSKPGTNTPKTSNTEISLLNEIIGLMKENDFYETDSELFEIGKDLVFYVKKKDKVN